MPSIQNKSQSSAPLHISRSVTLTSLKCNSLYPSTYCVAIPFTGMTIRITTAGGKSFWFAGVGERRSGCDLNREWESSVWPVGCHFDRGIVLCCTKYTQTHLQSTQLHMFICVFSAHISALNNSLGQSVILYVNPWDCNSAWFTCNLTL
jgi:hypothetical protein